jgi:Na+-translocating ferredoxin:NAD+ oxidoreductase RnfC subunit
LTRERWFGATGRKVPEIAAEGDLDLDEALVLTDVSDTVALAEAHATGRPVVVRASTAAEVKAALERPEVSSVLVPASAPELLDLNLTELTYG